MELKEALLYEKLENQKVKCNLCSFHCLIENGKMGVCKTRINKNGVLYTLNYGRANGYSIEPIEKKPFFHFHPSSEVLSFGTPGCNFSCLNCQNYFMSQSTKEVENAYSQTRFTSPEEIVKAGREAEGFAYTYTEPTVFFEYSRDCILEEKRKTNKFHVWVSNGFYSEQLLSKIIKEDLLDAVRIDLKFTSEEKYAEVCKARFNPVIENIKKISKTSVHLELINLIIPGYNDSEQDLEKLVDLIHGIDKAIPLHFLRFYPYYKMSNIQPTSDETLKKAFKIGMEKLDYVYIGNASIKGSEDTLCPNCKTILIKRKGMIVVENNLTEPFCPKCGNKINIKL
ncbi:MAG: AmmeMemoRadiSam system radical SAM enzyme [Candidatus Marsarchaeota archaeon]|nr:AmmeMemoRadiSam system radical SAM enzyme [Candidatus Marsarchaeota archaeon]